MKEERFLSASQINDIKTITMKQGIFRFIGILALIYGFSRYYRIITDAIQSPVSLSPDFFISTIFAWIAIYGGYQTIKLKEIGRKLLLIYFSYPFILILFNIFVVALAIMFHQIQWDELELQPLSIRSTYLLIPVISLVLLLRKNIIDVFQSEKNPTHIGLIGKILSFMAPGLGRALIGSTWKGLLLFSIYFFLFTGFHISGTENMEFLQPGLSYASIILVLFIKLIIWWLFFEEDWLYVTNNVKTAALSPTEPLYSA